MFTPAVSSRVIDGWGSTGVGLFNVNIVGWTHNSSHAVGFAEDISGGICIYIYVWIAESTGVCRKLVRLLASCIQNTLSPGGIDYCILGLQRIVLGGVIPDILGCLESSVL